MFHSFLVPSSWTSKRQFRHPSRTKPRLKRNHKRLHHLLLRFLLGSTVFVVGCVGPYWWGWWWFKTTTAATATLSTSHEMRWWEEPSSSDTGSTGINPNMNNSLPIFWINLDRNTVRRQAFETSFHDVLLQHSSTSNINTNVTLHRVRAVDEADLVQLLVRRQLVVRNGLRLDFQSALLPSYVMHLMDVYQYREAACSVSHLKAILRAYRLGLPYALFLEDDVALQPQFLQEWMKQVALAPADWTCLQWLTCNRVDRERGLKMVTTSPSDAWLSWQPNHWSTAAYMLNREGMRTILQHTWNGQKKKYHYSSNNNRKDDVDDDEVAWKLDEPQVLVADELLFSLAGRTYTTTYPGWFEFRSGMTSSMRSGPHESVAAFVQYEPWSSLKQLAAHAQPRGVTSILVLTNFRVASPEAVVQEIDRLRLDTDTMMAAMTEEGHHHHPGSHVNCVWRVNAVLTNQSLRPILLREMKRLTHSEFIEVDIHVSDEWFNKFAFYAKSIPDMANFDRILLKDNDMRIAGFPWVSFLQSVENATLAAPLYQSVSESMFRNLGWKRSWQSERQWFQLHNAANWVSSPSWTHLDAFRNLSPIQVPFLEQAFVLIDGRFAEWFFKQVLTEDFVHQPSDWGPDKMWCAAATEYDPSRPSCILSPLIVQHEDARQITVSSISSQIRGKLVMDSFKHNETLKRWMEPVSVWEGIIGGRSLGSVKRACMFLTRSLTFSIEMCAQLPSSAAHEVPSLLLYEVYFLRTLERAPVVILVCCLYLWLRRLLRHRQRRSFNSKYAME